LQKGVDPFFMAESTVLVDVEGLAIARANEQVLHPVSLQIRSDQCWAVVGPIGSGKTTFLQALAGSLAVRPGMIHRHSTVAYVSFKEESRQFSYGSYFYQQRYQATMSDDALLLRTYLQLPDTQATSDLIRRLGLEPLLDLSFMKLSNGQTRKARIAKALVKHPPLLLLDNPYVGLDSASRIDLTTWLHDMVQRGSAMVLVTDSSHIPSFVTHILQLGSEGSWAGPKEKYEPWPEPVHTVAIPQLQTEPQLPDFTSIFQLNDISVRYGERLILDDLNWTVEAGQKWALVGPNGVGKSVLLSLLYGDHPQAYANDVRVFGHRRGKSGESIWDVKRRIGFVSPELHLYFPQHLTARQVILSGLTDTLTTPRTVRAETEADLMALAQYFGVFPFLDRLFGSLSTGEQRLTLFIRALIKNPPVLLLDEPFQAFDKQHVFLARQFVDTLQGTGLLFVTHDRTELPQTVDKVFELHKPTLAPPK
jgi:molybdate transport system ATP-binding protein